MRMTFLHTHWGLKGCEGAAAAVPFEVGDWIIVWPLLVLFKLSLPLTVVVVGMVATRGDVSPMAGSLGSILGPIVLLLLFGFSLRLTNQK